MNAPDPENKQVTSSRSTYLLPAVQAVGLHLLVIALFTVNWDSSDIAKSQPRIIAATIMPDPVAAQQRVAAAQAEQQRKEDAARRAAEQKVAEQKAAEQRAAEQKKQAAEEAARKKAADDAAAKKKAADDAARKKAEEDAARKKAEEAARLKAEADRARQLQQELDAALAAESAEMTNANNTAAVASYQDYIQGKIIQNWSRPLSARNGMKVTLLLNLVPTGEVSNVSVVSSSGDSAFDRSAIQAVQRVGKFEELQKLSPSQFNANFRQLRLIFQPEDLDR